MYMHICIYLYIYLCVCVCVCVFANANRNVYGQKGSYDDVKSADLFFTYEIQAQTGEVCAPKRVLF